jgi:putative pyruvate formate lyase activating enzyme
MKFIADTKDKIYTLKKILEDCTLCPRQCHVNRIEGHLGYCRLPAKIVLDCALSHHGEEPPLSGTRGAGTIFLSSCNLFCIYCQNYQISHNNIGKILSPLQLADIMIHLQEQNCHNIEPVTPTPQTPLVVEALFLARQRGLKIPFVYNCGGYENPEIIKLLDGVVDVYLPDFKYGLENDALLFSSAPHYPRFALDALKEMVKQVGDKLILKNGVAHQGIIIRHLVIPNRVENSLEVLNLIKKELSTSIFLSIMSQYTPTPKVNHHPVLGRRIKKEEYKQVVDYALELGFQNLFIQEVSDNELTPDFTRDNPFAK